MRQNNNIPVDAGHFLRTEIHSANFENENSTTIRRQKNHILKKKFQNILKQTQPSKKIRNKYHKKRLD